VEITIEGLGARGDGFASLDGRPVFVPFTVAGDRARVRLTGTRAGGFKGELLELVEAGPGRAEPPCPHFGVCGGCVLQHMGETAYVRWKQGLVTQALSRRGFREVPVKPMIRIAPGTRRRATLAATRIGAEVALGFHGRESHEVADIETCLLLTPRLVELLPPLRRVLSQLLEAGEIAAVTLTETEEGPDLLVVSKATPDLAAREALAVFAEGQDLARLSWAERVAAGEVLAPEPVAGRRPPRVRFAGVAVEPPPGGFLQPTAEGQAALTGLVLSYLPEAAETLADLYAGCGTFTFPLAQRACVHAVERDEAALAALWAAARKADLAGRVTVEARDLTRAPIMAEELEGGDAVVFDPLRAGAREQAAALAESSVPAVIAVSCNPNSFARDARILVDGGFTLIEVTPVDQFPWAGHLELVASFRR
jgi:23S rRNA (uracil1939-C5)-methyltransferase